MEHLQAGHMLEYIKINHIGPGTKIPSVLILKAVVEQIFGLQRLDILTLNFHSFTAHIFHLAFLCADYSEFGSGLSQGFHHSFYGILTDA